jgi:hypothetical protein
MNGNGILLLLLLIKKNLMEQFVSEETKRKYSIIINEYLLRPSAAYR